LLLSLAMTLCAKICASSTRVSKVFLQIRFHRSVSSKLDFDQGSCDQHVK
jgi:hypothetical protein